VAVSGRRVVLAVKLSLAAIAVADPDIDLGILHSYRQSRPPDCPSGRIRLTSQPAQMSAITRYFWR
jgi:hypothetical protein